VHGGVSRFTEHGVVFDDGSEVAFDAVVLATGYRPQIEDFLLSWREACDEAGMPLASGKASPVPGLYFCGFFVAPSGMLREIGIEAKDIASAIAARG